MIFHIMVIKPLRSNLNNVHENNVTMQKIISYLKSALIAINCIQNKKCGYIIYMYVYCVYLLCIYKYTHIQ